MVKYAAIGIACALAGCVESSPRGLARADFSTTYACPKQQVALHGDDSDTPFEASGCGHREVYTCRSSKLLQKLLGTVECRTIRELAMYTAADAWHCPVAQVAATADRAETVDAQHYAVEGCGTRAAMACDHAPEPVVRMVEGNAVTTYDLRWTCTAHAVAIAPPPAPVAAAPAAPAPSGLPPAAALSTNLHPIGQLFTVVGPKVLMVQAGSTAATAGLATGDVILEIDHHPIGDDPATAPDRIATYLAPGASHVVHVLRSDTTLDLTIAP